MGTDAVVNKAKKLHNSAQIYFDHYKMSVNIMHSVADHRRINVSAADSPIQVPVPSTTAPLLHSRQTLAEEHMAQ